MTSAEKLQALVQAGFDRAWEFDNLDKWSFGAIHKTDTVRTDWYQVVFTHGDQKIVIDAERILFDPLFARALFGDKFDESKAQYIPHTGESNNPEDVTDWYGKAHYNGPTFEYRLMMAVISDSPIDYMYKEVFGDR